MVSDPSKALQPPRVERKMPEILSIAEVDLLLRQPKTDTPKGIRDKAMLEMLYATGIRVSELIASNLEDVNMRMGFITCAGEQSHARIVPLGRPARAALENYIYEARDQLLRGKEEEQALFINFYGNRMTRQGFPAASTPAGISRVTTLPAPMTVLSPIVTPGLITVCPPIQTWLPMRTGFPYSSPVARAVGSSGWVAV